MRHWNQWHSHAVRSRIDPLRLLAKRLKADLHGILGHCVYPLHTSLLEGINNKIKVIKRMAYGFRDDDYIFLKIRAALPGSLPAMTDEPKKKAPALSRGCFGLNRSGSSAWPGASGGCPRGASPRWTGPAAGAAGRAEASHASSPR